MPPKIDLTNQRFGRLRVLYQDPNFQNEVRWICQCDCGTQKSVSPKKLKSGNTKSCGCYRLEFKRKPIGEAAKSSVYARYKHGAKARNYPFELTKEQAEKLFESACFYCGSEPSAVFKHKFGNYYHSGIDRLNNSIGYTVNNCVPCCSMCNQAKHTHTLNEFMSWVKRVNAHSAKQEI